jgi:hypothetical protein
MPNTPESASKAKKPGRPVSKNATSITMDKRAREWCMQQMQSFLDQKNTECKGNPNESVKHVMDHLSGVIFHSKLPPPGLKAAIQRVSGFSRAMMQTGLDMHKSGGMTPPNLKKGKVYRKKRSAQISGPKKKVDNTWIWKWFHGEECFLTEEDKTRPTQLKGRKTMRVGNEQKKLVCSRAFMHGNQDDMVQCFFSSGTYKQHLAKGGDGVSKRMIKDSICKCFTKAKVTECACRTCTEFKAALAAWQEQRQDWHEEDECVCEGCSNEAAFKRYKVASRNVAAFRDAVLCDKIPFPHLKLPHQPDITPHFRSICCCKFSDGTPAHAPVCGKCGVDRRLYR